MAGKVLINRVYDELNDGFFIPLLGRVLDYDG